MAMLDILLLFLVGNVLGFVLETLYCYLLTGKYVSRRGVVYGPFNQIYGFGAVLMTLLLKSLAEKSLPALFIGSAVLGGIFEIGCSLFQEKTYGTVSWEYSGQRFAFFGGRTSLKFMFFWGILGTVYIGVLHPILFAFFGRIPLSVKAPVVLALTLFLIYDLWLSYVAVGRWRKRLCGTPGSGRLDAWLDEKFTDERMKKLYPAMRAADRGNSASGSRKKTLRKMWGG